uniref:Ig-like domain-containing protein n=1 Tax=Acinetobacter sp. CFCC 10889 TaxID=1775557 RepID=UPI0013A70CC7
DKGQEVLVVAMDVSGNSSPIQIVKAPDLTPIIESRSSFTIDGLMIIGTAEANSTIKLLGSDGEELGNGQADANGNFKIDIKEKYLVGDTATVIREEQSGISKETIKYNPSLEVTWEANADGREQSLLFIEGMGSYHQHIIVKVDNKVVYDYFQGLDPRPRVNVLDKEYNNGEKITIISMNGNDESTAVENIIYARKDIDQLAPEELTYGFSLGGEELSGETENEMNERSYSKLNYMSESGSVFELLNEIDMNRNLDNINLNVEINFSDLLDGSTSQHLDYIDDKFIYSENYNLTPDFFKNYYIIFNSNNKLEDYQLQPLLFMI